MERVIRKRVTRVGSGAYSIYIPKKWIDTWTERQQEEREVDLRLISGGLLIAPVHVDTVYEATVPSVVQSLRVKLLSAYVRGYTDVRLKPDETFDNETVAAARDFLRHLDERLVAQCNEGHIGFTLRPDLPPPATTGMDLVLVLSARTREVLRLVRDAIESYGHDPDRTLHALRLLRDTHEEDVSRLYYQVLRLVATLEIPLDSVTDYQLLGMAAASLHQTSAQAAGIGAIILADYDLRPEDLDFPRAHLLERVGNPPLQTGVARELVRTHLRAVTALLDCLDGLTAAFQTLDVEALAMVQDDAATRQDEMQQGIFQAVAENWGHDTPPTEAMAAFTASKISAPLGGCFHLIESIARSSGALLAARPEA